MISVDCRSSSEEETVAVGWRLARVLRPGSLVMIHGDIGVGKTVLARGLIHGLGHGDPYVTSPTFTLVNVYTEGRLPVYHFDLYRLVSIEELFISGAGDYLDAGGVCLVEWPEILIARGLKDYLDVIITTENNGPLTNREIVMRSHGPSSDQLLQLFS